MSRKPKSTLSGRFNCWLARHLADALASMLLFWLVVIAVLVPLLWQRPENLVLWIIYISSTCFQAIALPVLAFVAKGEGERNRHLLQVTHDIAVAERKILQQELRMIQALVGGRAIKHASGLTVVQPDKSLT